MPLDRYFSLTIENERVKKKKGREGGAVPILYLFFG
jgi:hypothetical protein